MCYANSVLSSLLSINTTNLITAPRSSSLATRLLSRLLNVYFHFWRGTPLLDLLQEPQTQHPLNYPSSSSLELRKHNPTHAGPRLASRQMKGFPSLLQTRRGCSRRLNSIPQPPFSPPFPLAFSGPALSKVSPSAKVLLTQHVLHPQPSKVMISPSSLSQLFRTVAT